MKFNEVGNRLYTGETSVDFVGKKKLWYVISLIIIAVAAFGLFGRGLNLGIEFEGGAKFNVPSTISVEDARNIVKAAGVQTSVIIAVGNERLEIQIPPLEQTEIESFTSKIAVDFNVDPASITTQSVGPSWGADITRQALIGLGVFILLVILFLTVYFELRMAAAAIVALLHDLLITIGVYAITGFEVTPATVIGILTILGYSLYDTVVVFDKVKENTRGIIAQSRLNYRESANLALNQTLIRSINTSIVALLPVAAILIVGVGILQAGTLKDLALALFVGIAAGTYSSIFIATPFLVQLKERQPDIQALSRRVHARRVNAGTDGPEAMKISGDAGLANQVLPAGPRTQPKRFTRSKRKKS
ncbi:protein translocase subunit SecF [Actinomycetes bacterium]|nr:protein translocase subunit SecF [Actinomycetes bacterium]